MWNAWAWGTLERSFSISRFTPDGPITVTRIEVQLQIAGLRCRRDPTLTLSDGTAKGTTQLVLHNTSSDSGPLSIDVPAGATIRLDVDEEARDCRTRPAGANIVVQYKAR
jgi:hypothetical protein